MTPIAVIFFTYFSHPIPFRLHTVTMHRTMPNIIPIRYHSSALFRTHRKWFLSYTYRGNFYIIFRFSFASYMGWRTPIDIGTKIKRKGIITPIAVIFLPILRMDPMIVKTPTGMILQEWTWIDGDKWV